MGGFNMAWVDDYNNWMDGIREEFREELGEIALTKAEADFFSTIAYLSSIEKVRVERHTRATFKLFLLTHTTLVAIATDPLAGIAEETDTMEDIVDLVSLDNKLSWVRACAVSDLLDDEQFHELARLSKEWHKQVRKIARVFGSNKIYL